MLKVYNTLSKSLEEFIPLSPPEVKMYVCGPTPYDHTHVGHVRTIVNFDFIRRYLEFKGYEVFHISNITDVDDKIINRALEKGMYWKELTETYIKEYVEVMNKLNVLSPHVMPKVSDHIEDIVKFISSLMERSYAYESGGSVYFEVDKFPYYGALSGATKEEEWEQELEFLMEKKRPYDFALWKKAKPKEPYWDSPWGPGRPGWHIECSVMSSKYLGEQFDIHGGGRDLIFPHHENEVAQSECAFGKRPWVKYWIHIGYLTVGGEKMSKSLGNIIIAKDVLEKYDADVIRLYMLSTHYRSPLDFTYEGLDQASKNYARILNTIRLTKGLLREMEVPSKLNEEEIRELKVLQKEVERFFKSLEEDFNAMKAMPYLFSILTIMNKAIMEGKNYPLLAYGFSFLKSFSRVFGVAEGEVLEAAKIEGLVGKLIELIIEVRRRRRLAKDWEIADWIRFELNRLGVRLVDQKDKTLWFIKS